MTAHHSGSSASRGLEGETRHQILMLLLKHSPASAANLGQTLGLATAGVRRHLDILIADGLVEAITVNPSASRGRGRPAKAFRLTDHGRATFGHDYDRLAALALAALRASGGDDAVDQFAQARIQEILTGVTPADSSPESVTSTAAQLVDAFTAHGIPATIQETEGSVQICQHHCPISHVASQFPELCQAEHEAIAKLVGQHVQPLASIATGHGICTTNIPLRPVVNSNRNQPQSAAKNQQQVEMDKING